MAIALRNNSTNNAEVFVNDVTEVSDYYVFFGNPHPWPDETAPPAVLDTVENEQKARREMLYGKKITDNDIMLMARRVDWKAGTVYQQFDVSAQLFQGEPLFYAYTDERKVYKCIWNNQGKPSTVKPTSTDTSHVFKTSDGYVWKFLFQVSAAIHARFASELYFPVTPNRDVATSAEPGAVYNVVIEDTGQGYVQFNEGNLQNIINSTAVVLDVTASNITRFYNGCSFYMKSISDNDVNTITSYDSSTRVATLEQPLVLTINLNVVSTAGFFANDVVYQSNNVSGVVRYVDSGSTELGFNQNSNLKFQIGEVIQQTTPSANGVVVAANNTYVHLLQVTGNFIPAGEIRGLSSAASGSVTSINNVNVISIQSDSREFVSGKPLYKMGSSSNTIVSSLQRVPDDSASYVIAPRITADGDGDGFSAIAIVDSATNRLDHIEVIKPGREYSKMDLTISGINTANARIRPILSPVQGHGYYPERELGVNIAGITLELTSNEGNRLLVPEKFRTVGIIKDIKYCSNTINTAAFNNSVRLPINTPNFVFNIGDVVVQETTKAKGTIINRSYDLILQNVAGISIGTRLTQVATSASGVVSKINGSYVSLVSVQGTFVADSEVISASGGVTRVTRVHDALYLANTDNDFVASNLPQFRITNQNNLSSGYTLYPDSIKFSDLEKNSGKLIYIENSTPITKGDLTSETFKLYIKF